MCVLEAAGAGLPIILRDLPEYDDTFKQDAWRCNDGEFIEAVRKLRRSKTIYRQWQQKSKAIAERFDSAQAAERLVKIYRKLV